MPVSYIYWFPVEPGCFKVGKSDVPARSLRHGRLLPPGYHHDPSRLAKVAVPREQVAAIKRTVLNWLVEVQGFEHT